MTTKENIRKWYQKWWGILFIVICIFMIIETIFIFEDNKIKIIDSTESLTTSNFNISSLGNNRIKTTNSTNTNYISNSNTLKSSVVLSIYPSNKIDSPKSVNLNFEKAMSENNVKYCYQISYADYKGNVLLS